MYNIKRQFITNYKLLLCRDYKWIVGKWVVYTNNITHMTV